MIKYCDNFLTKTELESLQEIVPGLTYNYHHTVVPDSMRECDPLQNFQFVHPIVGNEKVVSPHFPLFKRLFLNKLNVEICGRMKVNVTINTDKIVEHGYHTDLNSSDIDVNMYTAIFYFNTCDGYTAIKTKKGKIKKVQSVENRICIFPAQCLHTGTTTSDSKTRTVLNIVYREKTL